MMRAQTGKAAVAGILAAVCGALLSAAPPASAPARACRVLADRRLAGPVGAIVAEYRHRTGAAVRVETVPADRLGARVASGRASADVVVCRAAGRKPAGPLAALPGVRAVAWKHPTGEPVLAAALTSHPRAAELAAFLGSAAGHRLWADAPEGYRIASGRTPAEAYEWIVRNRSGRTYPMTARRILAELGGIREGLCIDVGCGSGLLDIELARRSKFRIIGVDIDPNVRPLFERNVRQAGLEGRIRFVLGDARKLPFDANTADAVISRGVLTFLPEKVRCLREVRRVLKPTGVAFLGGRYLYTPRPYRTSTDELRRIVREANIPGARVVEGRGQWVKIAGPDAPAAAARFQGGPGMLAGRLVADYGITDGNCLLLCRGDGGLERGLLRGLLDITRLKITALYGDPKAAASAREHFRDAAGRVTCRLGRIEAIDAPDGAFDLVAGVGPVLLFSRDRPAAMREIHRVLAAGGAALVGGRFLHMPAGRKVPSETLRAEAASTGLPGLRVIDDMGQWVEVLKGVRPARPPQGRSGSPRAADGRKESAGGA